MLRPVYSRKTMAIPGLLMPMLLPSSEHRHSYLHDGVIKWKHFSCYWPFVRGIHRSPANCPHKGQWRGALMFSLISAWINRWVNNREAGDLRRHPASYDVILMFSMQDKLFASYLHENMLTTRTSLWHLSTEDWLKCKYMLMFPKINAVE